MAPDAGTPAGEAPRHRTLDDIRREIDAEYSESSDGPRVPTRTRDEDADVGDNAISVRHLRAEPAGRSHWRGYLMAGAIGCIAGQLIILGYVAVTRYGANTLLRAASTPRVSAPLLQTDDTAVLSASIPSAGAPSPATIAPTGTVPPSEEAATSAEPVSASGGADAARGEPESVTPVAALPALPASVREPRNDVPRPPPAVRDVPRKTVAAQPPLRRPLIGPGDWVQSQAQLRSALSEWLALFGRDDTDPPGAEVILGADGLTAKTRVPWQSRSHAVIREQLWERGAHGWKIVEDREVERARP